MKRIYTSIFLLVALSLLFQHCNRDEENVTPVITNEGLTTVRLHLVNNTNAADTLTAQWEQLLDNNGRPLPVNVSKAKLVLKANQVYTGTMMILDKSQKPAGDVTQEVKDRSVYHILFYQPLPATGALVIPHSIQELYPEPIPSPLPAGGALNLTVESTDKDPNNLPIGLATRWTTGAASNGWVQVVLRHQPAGKDGTYTPGSTDMNVGFGVEIAP